MDLHVIWFLLLGVLLAGYAILDGFDLGVGILHPLHDDAEHRQTAVRAIGPLWDGNEVWLVTFGGAMFAAFPEAYATIFSAFYTPIMVLLFCLIFRAVSLEFRSKFASRWWKHTCDAAFFLSSLVATFLFGMATGNGVAGLPLDDRGEFIGRTVDLIGPYPLLVGALAVAMFALHGALFLYLKTAGELRQDLDRLIWHTWGIFLVLYMLSTMYSLASIPRTTANFADAPWAYAVVVLNVLAIANIPRTVFHDRYGQAFVSSCVNIACQVFLVGMALFPNLVAASNDPALSLTVYNAASSEGTLGIMLMVALIGMPLVATYTAIVYWTFRGKVSTVEPPR